MTSREASIPPTSWPSEAAARKTTGWWRRAAVGTALALVLSMIDAEAGMAATPLEKAKDELAQNDPRTAIIHLRNAIRENPDDLPVRRLLGKLYLDIGKPAAAEDHLLKAQEREAEVEAGVHLADAQLQLGKAAAALRGLTKIEQQFDDYAAFEPFGLVKARTLMALERLDEAQAVLESYLRKQPLDGEALVTRAQMHMVSGEVDEASQAISRALDVDPKSPFALWVKVDIDAAVGRFEAAENGLDRLAEVTPGNPEIAVSRARILFQTGKTEEAKERLENLLGEQPGLPSAVLLLAGLASAEGRVEDCQRILQSISSEARDSEAYLLLSGLTHAADGNYSIAETALADYIERVPNDQSARLVLGNVRLNANVPGLAISTLEPLADVDQPPTSTLQLLASAQIRAGKLDAAAASLDRIVAASPPALTGNARSMLALIRDESLGENRADAALAFDHLHYGDAERADKLVTAMVEAEPDNPTFLNLDGIVRFRLGDEAAARAAFERVLKIDPGHEDAASALNQLDIRAGDIASVEQRLRTGLDQQKACEACAIDLASLLTSNGRGDEAYQLLGDEAATQPDAILLRQALISTGIAIGVPVFDEPWLKELIAIGDRGVPAAYGAAGDLAARFGQLDLAAEAYQRLAKALPDQPGPPIAHARVAYQLGDIEAAKTSAASALSIEPGHPVANGILFDLSLESGTPSETQTLVDRLETIDSRLHKELLALFHLRSERPDDAIKTLKDALAAQPDPALAHRLFAIQREAGDLDGANAGLRSWLIREPSDTTAMDLLGDAHVEQGDLRLGLRYYEQALRLNGDDPVLLNDTAWVRQELGMPEAETIAERAYAIAPLPEIADTLAWILVRQGKIDAGLPLLREAFQSRSDNPDIRYHLAYSLSESGDQAAARELLEPLASFEGAYAERQAALDLWEQLKP